MNHSKINISGQLIARNTILNFIGLVVPLLLGVVTIPLILRGLGTERFALMSLAWVVLGYFAFFDLGLGRATTKFVAEALGKGEEEQIRSIVWSAITFQAILGIVGGFALIGFTPLLVERVLNIPPALIGEAKATFYMLAISVPIVLVSISFSGVLEAKQRFDLVNVVRIPSTIFTYILILVSLSLDFQLQGIVALILFVRFMALSAMVILSFHIFPKLKKYSFYFAYFSRLFLYGSWITVSNIVGTILIYLDRFLIASFLSLSAVAYYAPPSEALTRLSIISGSLIATLFPAFSALGGSRERQRLETLFAHSVKYTILGIGPIVILLMLFAEDILQVWLGSNFAEKSKIVMQILALGVLINSIACVPYTLLQGVGRPDITAMVRLLEIPFYTMIIWLLVGHCGIAGVAIAWTLRVVLDAILLFMIAFKVCQLSPGLFATNGLTFTSLLLLLLATVAYGLKSLAGAFPLFIQFFLFVALFGLFAMFVWRKVLDASDRITILKGVQLWRRYEDTI